MKMMVCIFLALVGTAAASSGAGDGSAPVDRIVKLLQTMTATVTKDGEQEAKAYNAHACWCETTAKTKASDIEAANADIRTFGQRVLKLKGQVAVASGEIEEFGERIKETQQRIEERTAIRKKENSAYQAETGETQEAMASLEKAIKMLGDATNAGKSALLQSATATQSRSAVANVLEKLPMSIPSLPDWRSKDVMVLAEFAKSSTAYAPQSATIQGILGDMYNTFAKTLQDSIMLEAKRNGAFEGSDAADAKTMELLTKQRDETAAKKAQSEAMLADTTSAFDDTQKQLQADIAFFDATKKQCETQHTEFTARTDARNTELEGLGKAIAILTSDDNRALFDKAIKPGTERSFLQLDNTPALLQGKNKDGAALAVAKAYGILKTQVQKQHSLRLASLAVSVRTAKVGHFDKIIASIDAMIGTLNDEAKADKEKKTECVKEFQENTKATNDLSWKVEVSDAKMNKLEGLIQLRSSEKAVTVKQIKEATDAITTMVKEREASHAAFLQSVKDDESAITALESAKKQLDFALSTATRDAGAAKTITTVFAAIIEDLHNEIKNGKKAEADAMRDHLEAKELAEKLVDDLTEKKVTLNSMIATRNSEKEDEGEKKNSNSKALEAKEGWQAKIQPDCDWAIKHFSERATARSAEMEGLQQAKAFLAGQTALLSKGESKLASIHFLGMK